MNQNTKVLFQPYSLGTMHLRNRFVMAPLTRGRANDDKSPNELMATYYRQRATAGLIITEATAISPQGVGWVGAPGIFSDNHVEGWKRITEAVHQLNGVIFLQLWHMGRVSHPDFLNGQLPWGPSAIAAQGDAHTPLGKKAYVTPKEMTVLDIQQTINEYAQATVKARQAGFDGVELHGANGYLIDQFLRDGSNQRDDDYGGSITNRLRFLKEVAQAVTQAWSPDRVGLRLSPVGAFNDMKDSNPKALFSEAAKLMNEMKLLYLHIVEGLPGSFMHTEHPERITPYVRASFRGSLIANGGYTAELAAQTIASGEADLVSFGVPFLTNPDFVSRVGKGAPLNAPDMSTFYTPGPKGYVDYPSLEV